MLWRIVVGLVQAPIILLYALLCLGLSAIGLGAAYLLLTLGVQMLNDPLAAWLLAAFGLLWAAFWLAMLGAVLRAAAGND